MQRRNIIRRSSTQQLTHVQFVHKKTRLPIHLNVSKCVGGCTAFVICCFQCYGYNCGCGNGYDLADIFVQSVKG